MWNLLCEGGRGDQCPGRDQLHAQCRHRPRQADGAGGFAAADAGDARAETAESARTGRPPAAETGLRSLGPRHPHSCNPAAGASSPGTQTGGVPAAVVPVQLRCVGISPRLVSFAELEPGDCRYPYGGDKDDEAIAFCGHPRRDGASYCTPHFHLTRVVVGTEAERAVGPITLRLVQAA